MVRKSKSGLSGLVGVSAGQRIGRLMASTALVAAAMLTLPEQAYPQTWKGGSGDWDQGSNWIGGSAPDSIGATATFNAPVAAGVDNVSLTTHSFQIGALNLDGGQNRSGYSFGAGTLIMRVATGQARINVNADEGILDFGQSSALILQLNSDTNVTTAAGATVRFGSQSKITGNGALIFSGLGTATLTGANTYTGGTTISGGVLLVDGSDGTARSAISIGSGGTLNVGATGAVTASGITNNAGGAINVASGGSVTGGSDNFGSVNNAGADNANVGNETTGTVTNSGTWAGNLVRNRNASASAVRNSNIWNGDANNAGGLTNAGTWTTVASGFVNSGTLNTTNAINAAKGGFTNTGTVNAHGALLGAINNNAGAFALDGALVGDNSFTNSGMATLNVGAFGLSGMTTLTNQSTSASAVNVTRVGSITASVAISNIAGTFTNAGTLTAPTISNRSAGTLVNTGVISGAVNNSATFDNSAGGEVSRLLTNSMGVTVNAGVISAAVINSATFDNDAGGKVSGLLTNSMGVTVDTGALTGGANITDGTVQIGNGGTTGSITGNITTSSPGALTFNRSNGLFYSGIISGAGTVNQTGAGDTILSGGSNTAALNFTGAVNVNSGVLQVSDTFGDVKKNTATFIVNSGGTLRAIGAIDGSVTVNNLGILLGTGTIGGSVTVNSGGALSVVGAIDGNVTINTGGTLSAGGISPAANPEKSTIDGNLTLSPGSTINFVLNSPGALGPPGNDLITVGGNLTLGGTLDVSKTGGGAPAPGYYTLFDYTGTAPPSGSFVLPTGDQILTNIKGQVNLLITNSSPLTQYWDGPNMTGVGSVTGGAGVWGAAKMIPNTNWTASTGKINDSWRNQYGVFEGTTAAAPVTVTVSGTQSFESLEFKTNGYTLTGGTLKMTGAPTASNQSTLDVDGGVEATIGSQISGDAGIGLLKIGAGTLMLTSANNYTGPTTISEGTLQIGGVGSLGAKTNSLSVFGGTLDLGVTTQTQNGGVTLLGGGTIQDGTLFSAEAFALQSGMVSAILAGTGAVSKTTAGMVTLTGANTYTGPTTISAGTLRIGSAGSLGIGGSYGGAIMDYGTLQYSSSAAQTLSGVISGGGALIKDASSTLTLTNNNAYAGNTTINAGTLEIGRGSLGDGSYAGKIAIGYDATLEYSSSAAQTLWGVISGQGALTKDTSDTSTLMLKGVNTYKGATTISEGTLRIGRTGSLGRGSYAGEIAIGYDATLEYSSSAAQTLSGVISGRGALTKDTSDTSTLTLKGVNTYHGPITISAGTLRIGGTGSLRSGLYSKPIMIGDNGTLQYSSSAPQTLSGVISGHGALKKDASSTLTLKANNTYTGNTTINAGTLEVDGGFLGSGNYLGAIAIRKGGTLQYSSGAPQILAGVICGGGALTKGASAPSKLTLMGMDSYTGITTISTGTLQIGGTGSLGRGSYAGAIVDNGSLVYSSSAAQTLSGKIAGSGGLTKDMSDTSTLILTGADTYMGPTTIGAGTLQIGGAGSLGGGSYAGPITDNGTLDYSSSLPQTLSGISGGGGLTKDNSSTLTLTGANTYKEVTNVNAGELAVSGSLGSPSVPGGAINIQPGATLAVRKSGAIDIAGSTLTNSGTVDARNQIAGAIVNNATGVIDVRRNLTTGAFNNSGSLNFASDRYQLTVDVTGNYSASGSNPSIDINLNLANSSLPHNTLTMNSASGGVTTVNVIGNPPLTKAFAPIPIIYQLNTGPSAATFVASNAGTNPFTLVSYFITPSRSNSTGPTTFELEGGLNLKAVGPIAGAIGSAVNSTATGFFQGATAFLGAPPNVQPNFVDGGVWVRGAAGMNDERSVAQAFVGGTAQPSDGQTMTHFSGVQVGSDLGLFNVQNTGWNLHTGITGGQYQTTSSDLDGSTTTTAFQVPFLGLYAAATGRNFTADVLVRHDFWQGVVSNFNANLTNAKLTGSGNAVTAEAAYRYLFENGVFVVPSAGFSYTHVSFGNLPFLPGSFGVAPILDIGPVQSELGRLGVQVGDSFAVGEWSLIPTFTASVWHEFAGPIPSLFTSNQPTETVSVSRVGTFGQFGVGLAGQPADLPNLTTYVRADYRTGSNIYGGTFTAGLRYQF